MSAADSGGASTVRVVGSGADNHDASWRAKCPTPRRWRTRRHGPASASPNCLSGRAVGLDRRQRNSEQIRQFFLDFDSCLGPVQATPKLGVFPLHPRQFRRKRRGYLRNSLYRMACHGSMIVASSAGSSRLSGAARQRPLVRRRGELLRSRLSTKGSASTSPRLPFRAEGPWPCYDVRPIPQMRPFFSIAGLVTRNKIRPDASAMMVSMRISQEQYGNRQGIPRIRRLLEKHSIPATFFYPAMSALLHPDEVRGIAQEGNEIGIHSWIHWKNTDLPFESERDLSLKAADVLEGLTGVRPVGMRTTSWDFSVNMLRIIREMGLLYDSSLMADDEPYEIVADGEPTGVVELPPEWIRDDAVYFNMLRFSSLQPYTPPSAVEENFRVEFEGTWEEGGLFLLTMHPHVIGHRSRMPLLSRLVDHMKQKGGCWFAAHAKVAEWCRDQATPPLWLRHIREAGATDFVLFCFRLELV
jgi:peptidoglycan/xylan/chitin deacetylase (PgdA/CDA1 family)